MTLALAGKTRRRRTFLVFAAFIAIIISMAGGASLYRGESARASQPVTGAVNTTTADGTVQNGNTKYAAKCDVYLRSAQQGQSNLGPDGIWYIRVSDPSGADVLTPDILLPDDGYFQAEVTGGVFTAYWTAIPATDATKVTIAAGQPNTVPLCARGVYDDTPNLGGEYKAWASISTGFEASLSKTDNFKVKGTNDREITITKVRTHTGTAAGPAETFAGTISANDDVGFSIVDACLRRADEPQLCGEQRIVAHGS